MLYNLMDSQKIEKLYGSRVRTKILDWFFSHKDESYFVRQVASIVSEDPTNVSREMAGLEILGILKSKRLGNLKHFQVDPACPFFHELRGLVLKTTGIAGQIREALERLAGIDYAFVYGPRAAGKKGSEVDLVIVGEVDLARLDVLLKGLGKKIGNEINYIFYNRVEFKSQRAAQEGVLAEVLQSPKLMVIGVEEGLKAGT
jgi:uncharacterized protein